MQTNQSLLIVMLILTTYSWIIHAFTAFVNWLLKPHSTWLVVRNNLLHPLNDR